MGAIAVASASLTSASVIGAIAAASRSREVSAATAGNTIKAGTMAVNLTKTFRGMGSSKGRHGGRPTLAIQNLLSISRPSEPEPGDARLSRCSLPGRLSQGNQQLMAQINNTQSPH
jgi:hypothetical protein